MPNTKFLKWLNKLENWTTNVQFLENTFMNTNIFEDAGYINGRDK